VTPTGGTYRELAERWKRLHDGGELSLREVPCGPGRALLCAQVGDPSRPAIAIAAGVHGDEPAGVWALLELAQARALDPRFSYRLWPCTNPTGFEAGTRANAEGLDVNRTFGGTGGSPEARAVLETNRGMTFALSLDLHEDCDAIGFYCYEYGGAHIGRHVIAALDARGFPIDPLDVTFALAGPLDDAHCRRERGRVFADAVEEAALIGGLSYSLAIACAGAYRALTFETPSSSAWELRVAMHRTAVPAAVRSLLEESPSTPSNAP
jgi:murein peptide amidase A